jgi:hypothetical protein
MSITDQIRKQLEQPDALTMESIEPLAEAYGMETQQANSRLAECIQLLRKGLRSEAIQRAAMKPNVLDWCARLDFPEIDDWFEILKFYGISVPPLLDRVAAQQLQEAIVDEQPLEELLRQHRRLAIGKAPLSWRLKVLRRLAQIDSVNSVWREDQEQWETIRLKQIPTELNRAIDAESLTDVQDLATELSRSAWLVTPSKELCKQAEGAANALIYKHQVLRLKRIVDKLHAAYSEGDEAGAEKHFKSYSAHVGQMVSPPSQELTQRAEPAIEWLTESIQAREKVQLFELNSAALESLLQGNASLVDLERAYYDVASLQMGIDPILEQRYETKVAQLKQQARRRLQMNLFGIAAGAVSLLIVFGVWQWNRSQRQTVSDAVAKLEGFIDAEDFAAAEGVVKQLTEDDSAVIKAPEVIALIESMKSLQAAEEQRRQRVEELISDAEEDDPSAIDANKLVLAEKEAKTPDEVIRVKRVRASLESYDRSVREIQSVAVKNAVTSFESQLLTIEQLPHDEIKDSAIDSIVIDLNKLSTEFPKALGTEAVVRPATDRAASIKKRVREQREEIALRQRSMRGLREAISLGDFTSELKKYADQLPGDKLAKQFADALTEQGLWKSIDNWNEWCVDTISAAQGGLTSEEIRKAHDTLASLNQNLTGTPGSAIVVDLEQLAAASEARATALKGLLDQFAPSGNQDSASQFAQLVTLIAPGKNGKRFFIEHESRARNAQAISKLTKYSKITLPIIANDSLQSEEIEFNGVVTIYEEPRATVRKLGDHFQRKEILGDWDTQMIVAIAQITEDKNLDCLLKESLLEVVVKAAGEGSKYLSESLSPVEKLLSATQEKRNLWFTQAEVNNQLSPEIRASLTVGVQKARASQAAFLSRLASVTKMKFTWVGAMLRDNSDKLESWLAKPDCPDGQLFTVLPSDGAKRVGQIVKVGMVRNKQASLTAPPEKLLAGRPLYWQATPVVPASTSTAPAAKKN